jgi:hypothetical protein
MAGPVSVPLLHPIGRPLGGQKGTDALAAFGDIVRMGDSREIEGLHFLNGITQHGGKGFVDLFQATVRSRQGHPDAGVFKQGPKIRFALAKRALGALKSRDILDIGGDPDDLAGRVPDRAPAEFVENIGAGLMLNLDEGFSSKDPVQTLLGLRSKLGNRHPVEER